MEAGEPWGAVFDPPAGQPRRQNQIAAAADGTCTASGTPPPSRPLHLDNTRCCLSPPSYKSLRVPHPMPSPPAPKHSRDRPSLVQTPPGLCPASDTQLGNIFCGDARSRSAITVSAALSVLDPEQLEPFLITTTTFPLLPLSQSTSYPLPGQQLGTVTVQLQRTSHDPTIPILTRTS